MTVTTPSGDRQFPLHVGNVDTCVRENDVVTLTGRNKSALLRCVVDEAFTIPAGTKITSAIRRIAIHGGETAAHISIPEKPRELQEDFEVKATKSTDPIRQSEQIAYTLWQYMEDLAAQIENFQLFYNQDGKLVGRKVPKTSSFTFRGSADGTDDGSYLTAQGLSVGADFVDFHNEVWFFYDNPNVDPIVRTFPPNHPLSKESLIRNGFPRAQLLLVTDYSIKLKEPAVARCVELIQKEKEHVVNVTAACKRFPWMEWQDLYQFDSEDYSDTTTVETSSMSLVPGTDMTLGWTDYKPRGI